MTIASDQQMRGMPGARTATGWHLPAMIVGATLLTVLMNTPLLGSIMHGGFADPDDAMRLVEVRAWLAGQPWYDVTAMRLDPPFGASMHWSRLVDVPTGLLIALFRMVADRTNAEGLARIVVPTALLAAFYWGMARLAILLLGRASVGTMVLGTIFSAAVLVQFLPGRIGHHAPETLALVLAVGSALASLDPARARQGAVAGALVALSLAVSLETLPFLAVLCVAMVALWVVLGTSMARALACFAVGLGMALPLVFVFTIPPAHWFAPVCDAYGAAHFGAGMIGAAGALLLSRLEMPIRLRVAAAAVVGLAVLAYVILAYPACLHSPFAGVDPLVRALWLDKVVESQPLATFMRTRPMLGLAVVIPVGLGLAGCIAAAFRREGIASLRFAVLAVLVGLGLALGCVQVRAFGSVTPLALTGAVYWVTLLRVRLAARGLVLLAAVAPIMILPFTGTAWALLLPDDRGSSDAHGTCLAPEGIAHLSRLPPGSLVGPIDMGSAILAGTDLTVFAAPYHRDNDGNRFALEVMLAPSAKARAMLVARHVRYVLVCMGPTEDRAVGGLAADLVSGRVPSYLKPVSLPSAAYRVFEVDPSDG